MSGIAQKISRHNLIPAIWIAPFICSKNSKIFSQHKDWLLKTDSGKPIVAGYNPAWGGKYFALDFLSLIHI